MRKVLVTGMSGTGKSAALQMPGERGHRVVDTDTDQYSHRVTLPDGSPDWIWREDANEPRSLLYLAEVEPLLRATATIEIDATAPLSQVFRQLEDLI